MMHLQSHFRFQTFLLLAVFWLYGIDRAAACGYSFIGNCSSELRFLINGTVSNYNVAECFYGTPLHGSSVGSIKSLAFHHAFAATWESCDNNVSGMSVRYRVTRQGYQGGDWKTYPMHQDSEQTILPYTARYFSATSDLNLTDGLTPGDYVIEIYIQADIDTLGNDFIPESVMLKNNEGLNYAFSFSYGGTSAPPFLAVPQLVSSPSCNGGSNGIAGVTVFGNTTGMTYTWSDGGAPISTRYNLPAGTHQVTVVNAEGASQVVTVEVPPPSAISVAFPVIRPLGCGGDGMVFAKGSGGTGPYNFTWSTGSLLPSTFVGSAGTVTVTVTDAQGCSKTASVPVPNGGTVRKNINASICIGESWVVDGVAYIQSGNYTYHVPGTLCDTTVYLALEVVNPADALIAIPEQVPVPDCSKEYGAEICATPIPGTSFVWENEGTLTGAQPCLKGLSASTYWVTAFRTVSGKLCRAARSIEVLQGNFTASIQGLVEPDYCNTQAPVSVELVASTTAANPTYTWRYGGNIIGQEKTLLFTITDWQQQPPTMPTLTVHDGGTCLVEATNQVVVLQPPVYDIQFLVKNATTGKSDGAVTALVNGGIPSFAYLWSNGAITPQIEMLPAGTYCLTVTDKENCTRTACATVSAISSTQEPDLSEKILLSPNPMGLEQVLILDMPAIPGRQKLDLRILDAYGRAFLCDFHNATESAWTINLPASLKPGIYILRGQLEGHFFNKKFEIIGVNR